jgi:undecaprenyl-diphosphatase
MNCGIAAHETIRRYCNEKIRQRKERKMSVLEFIKVVILGIVEGITEWLPISSTGHMILVDEFIKMEMTPEFKEFFLVVIQLGAILAVVVLYWSKLWPFYIREISPKKRKELNRMNPVSRMALTFVEKFCNKDKWILWFKILVACIPTIVIALPFNDIIEEKFNNYVVVAIALIVYGVIFILIENYNKRRKPVCTSLEELSFGTAFKIGIFQVLSVIPGTSRSGSTIIGGILVGTSRTVAAEFTFFLAIPVMFGASLLKLIKFGFAFTPAEILTLVTGVVVAFFVSIIAIKFLMGYIKKHDFKAFGWYRIVLGILVLGYFAVAVHR